MKSCKTLVTGGAGFIGSHLVERLIKDGHTVLVLDNFSNGKMENLDKVKNNPRLTIRHVDITDYKKIERFFKDIHWVFHLAALVDIVPSIREPLKYYRSNVDGTVSVLEASRMARVEKFVYAASSSCYGIPNKFPTSERAPIKPIYPYALTKYIGEQCAMHWSKVYKLPLISLRLFNVYGPRVRSSGTYGAVFGVFLAQKLARKPFTVVGDGRQTRDFTFVTDVVSAFIKAAQSKIKNAIFNVGSGKTYSINKLVTLLDGDVIHIPKRPGEPDCTFAQTRKIKKMLKWNPAINFEKGVSIMLQDIDKWQSAPVWTPEKIKKTTRDWFACLS